MQSRFLPLLTPVVFIARLSSGRQRQTTEGGSWGLGPQIYNPSVPPPTDTVLLSLHTVMQHVEADCVYTTLTMSIFTGSLLISRDWFQPTEIRRQEQNDHSQPNTICWIFEISGLLDDFIGQPCALKVCRLLPVAFWIICFGVCIATQLYIYCMFQSPNQ